MGFVEPAPSVPDPYQRARNAPQEAVVNRADLEPDEWLIEHLVDKKDVKKQTALLGKMDEIWSRTSCMVPHRRSSRCYRDNRGT